LFHVVPKHGDDLLGEVVSILALPLQSHHAEPHMKVGNEEPGLEAVRHVASYLGREY